MVEINETSEIIKNNNITKPNHKYAEALNKYFKLVVMLVAIIVLLTGYYLVIVTKLEIKSAKDKTLQTLQAEVDQLKADSDFLSQYSSTIIEFTPEENRKLNLALPSEFDLSSIIVQLTKLASDHQFIVENITASESPANNQSDSNIKHVDLAMKVSGVSGNDYGNFSKFIEALESSLMIFDVRSISFVPAQTGYDLELVTYYYPIK